MRNSFLMTLGTEFPRSLWGIYEGVGMINVLCQIMLAVGKLSYVLPTEYLPH